MRFIAKRIGGRPIHGFDSFEGLPEAWSGFNLGGRAFDVKGKLPRVPVQRAASRRAGSRTRCRDG